MDELKLRERYEKSVESLARDPRFLAVIDYIAFSYERSLHEYEYESSREALTATGFKMCRREMLEDFELIMNKVN